MEGRIDHTLEQLTDTPFTSGTIITTNHTLRFIHPKIHFVGRDCSVGIATPYGLDGPGIESRWGGDIFRTRPDRP